MDPAALLAPSAANVGVLIVSGVIVRQIAIDREPSAELLGPGDLIRPDPDAPPERGFGGDVRWHALTPLVVSPMGMPIAVALCRYPEVLLVLLERIETRARRLAVTQGISQLTGVEHRLEAVLRHLAERWGKVRPDGVLLPLDLSHRMLGGIIGARRPTVSSAAALLVAQGRISRLADGTWLLHDPPADRVLEHPAARGEPTPAAA